MKRNVLITSLIFAATLIFIICGCESATDPVPPPQHPDPPVFGPAQTVMVPGPAGSWDDKSVGWCSVLLDGDTLRMWYSANSYADNLFKIGYAWSLNGTEWNRYGDTYVMANTFEWEGPDFGQPVVIKDGDVFRMWYHGWSPEVPFVVGYAESGDGKLWTKHTDPVMELGFGGSITSYSIGLWTVMMDSDQLEGWYDGWNGDYFTGKGCIGYTTSADGVTWTDHGLCLQHTNVDASWEKDFAVRPIVVRSVIDGKIWYEMFYIGMSNESPQPQIGYATAQPGKQGTNWIKYTDNPVISHNDLTRIDGSGVSLTAAVWDPATGDYHLWYNENFADGTSEIRYLHGTRD